MHRKSYKFVYIVDEQRKRVTCRLTSRDNYRLYNPYLGLVYCEDFLYSRTLFKAHKDIIHDMCMLDWTTREKFGFVFDKNRCLAVAKCLPDDTFDVNTGKDIARRKLEQKLQRAAIKGLQGYINQLGIMLKNIEEQ